MRRGALGLVAVALGALAALAWGCATSEPADAPTRPPYDPTPTPDGGWVNYRPSRRLYDADPVQANTKMPDLSPATPVGTDNH